MTGTVSIGNVKPALLARYAALPRRIKLGILCVVILAAGAATAASMGPDSMSPNGRLKSRLLSAGGAMAFETRYATIITDSSSKARWADERLQEAAAHFVRTFGVSPGRGVIVETPYASYSKAIPKTQRQWTLPWMTRYFGAGERANAGPGDHHFDNESGILHELNHLFFTTGMIPNSRRFQYGGDAPDWLDEAAALAAESPEVKARRRANFYEQVCAGRLVPLDQFVVRQHPLLASPAMQKLIAARRNASRGAPMMMTVGEKQLGVPPHALSDFYAQSNAVAEFLAEVSGDPKVLRRIALSLKWSPEQTDGKRWIGEFTAPGDQPLGARFAAWARASARAGTPGCAASGSDWGGR